MINSVTGEEERLEAILPLFRKYNAAVIGISNDEGNISENPDDHFEIAKKIVQRAEDHGIPRHDVLIDPLAMPVGAVRYARTSLFQIVRRCREELSVNTACGASNISFGLPGRPTLNATFLAMAIGAGMPCAITNPLETDIRMAILAADVMMGHDENCTSWLAANHGDQDRQTAREERRARRRREPREQ